MSDLLDSLGRGLQHRSRLVTTTAAAPELQLADRVVGSCLRLNPRLLFHRPRRIGLRERRFGALEFFVLASEGHEAQRADRERLANHGHDELLCACGDPPSYFTYPAGPDDRPT